MSVPDVDEHGVVLLAPEYETVAEDSVHEGWVSWVVTGLKARYAARDDVAVHGRIAWFPDRENTRIRLDPDVMVVFGRPMADRSSYRLWNEEGVPPTVLIEVVSPNDSASDYDRRLSRARRYGAGEVVLIDPFGHGGVRVDHLLPDPSGSDAFFTVATSIAADAPLHVATLGISLAGGPTLVIADEEGTWPDATTAFSDARALRHRADAADVRADRLAAMLRDHGLDPDQL